MATSDKYDRQLRLWGASGQRALGETCVILVRASAAGTETAKNLVLPGIGAILVIDDASPCTSYASNFFLTRDESKPRAQLVMELLRELNPDVQGDWKHVDNLQTVDYQALFTSVPQKILVVASDLEPPILEQVGRACEHLNVPLVAVQSYGLLGVVRLQIPPHPLLDPKPRDSPPDLRLVRPFPRLQQLADSIQWNALENHQHKHVPYPLILIRIANEYRMRHGSLPRTLAEKQAFQDMIQLSSRNFDDELNFQEAKNNAYLAYSERELDREHLAQLRDNAASSPKLLLLLQGLERFFLKHQRAPLQGSIPDMTASTDLYVQLQSVYRNQATEDWQEMRAVPTTISDEELTIFCQNVFSVDLIKTRSLYEERTGTVPDEIAEDLAMATMEGDERPDQLPMLWYMGLSACQLFYGKFGRYPGVLEDFEQDVAPLQSCIVEIVNRYKLQDNELVHDTLLKSDDYSLELVRYGNAEIHNIGSVVGGVASQEVVKIVTGQYTPINNAFVYNGITSTAGVYSF